MSVIMTIRPGYLVPLRSGLRGRNRHYITEIVEAEHLVTEDGVALESEWTTRRIVEDPDEYKRAVAVQSKVRGQIVNVCYATSFGLMCPLEKKEELLAGIAEAQRIADEFNAESVLTRVELYVIPLEVASDDAAAIAAITREVRELLEDIEEGVQNMDATAIGKACDKLRDNSGMLTEEAQLTTKEAIDAARTVKRQILKMQKSGEQAKLEVDKAVLVKVATARNSFLDINQTDDELAAVKAPEAQVRSVDFGVEAEAVAAPVKGVVELEMDDAPAVRDGKGRFAKKDLDFAV